MELRQLKYFVAVAEELHFSRAAKRCHISQPPLSQQIKGLEEELGVTLLLRTNRRVELTVEGREFLGRARDILAQVDASVEQVRAMARGEEGRLRVGFIGPASLSRLPRAIRQFREENPRISLDFSALVTSEQLSMLQNDELDVAFVRLFGHEIFGLRTLLFLREPYEVALPEGHPLTELARVPLISLLGVPMIFNQRIAQPALYASLIGCFHKAGFAPRIVQEVNTEQSTVALVATGLGAALVPASSASDHRSGVICRPVDGDLPDWEITAVWKGRRESPLLTRFLDMVMRYRDVPLRDPAFALQGHGASPSRSAKTSGR
ncbi:MAG: LysR family transcriptional regulator [Proteobacteria bacterium]|nr:LysR family transcriptional regulator [Pseudomonadota bacterium]